MEMTPGQLAHAEDMRNIPFTTITGKDLYPRKTWEELGQADRDAWERCPIPRQPLP